MIITTHQAVCLWEDAVGDSGESPTDEELATFANAVLDNYLREQ